jgi:hypothetical protein
VKLQSSVCDRNQLEHLAAFFFVPMRTPTKDRLKDTVLHGIVQNMDFYSITVEDITEYKSRVPLVKDRVLSHREKAERERKRVEGLEKARQARRSKEASNTNGCA